MKNVIIILFILVFGELKAQNIHPCSLLKQQSHFQMQRHKTNATLAQMQSMEKYDVGFHHLSLNVERTSTTLSGSVQTIAKSKVNGLDTFLFQLHNNLIVDSVLGSNQQKLSFIRQTDICAVILSQPLVQNENIALNIYYHGTPPSGASAAIGSGFNNRSSPTYGNQITWSLSQPYSAYEWWPCKQSLQDKIDSIYVSVTTDTSNKVGSNGLLNFITMEGNGKHTYHWQSHYPINYYLVMVTVGKYTEYRQYAKPKGLVDSLLIQHYIYDNPLAYANNANNINATKPQIELFSELFGLYPFYKEKYGHVMAPFSGGMEHQTMSSMGIFNFGIVAHEAAHQWFGDQVTCATWSDIWLNEGFASYSEYLAKWYLQPTTALEELTNMHIEAKREVGSVYVTDTTDVTRIFSSALTYNKGAAAIRVMHYLLGDSLFFEVCKAYQLKFAHANASTKDFNLLVNELSKKDYDYFFEQWIYGKGYPSYLVSWNEYAGNLTLKITQSNPQNGELFSLPIQIKATRKLKGDTLFTIAMPSDSIQYNLAIGDAISAIVIDPASWILKNVSYKNDLTLGLGSFNKPQGVKLFPNPSTGIIRLEPSGQTPYKVTVFELSGKAIDTYETKEDLDLSNLTSGLYLLILEDIYGQKQTIRLVKE